MTPRHALPAIAPSVATIADLGDADHPMRQLALVCDELLIVGSDEAWVPLAHTLLNSAGALDEVLDTATASRWLTAAQLVVGRNVAWLEGTAANVAKPGEVILLAEMTAVGVPDRLIAETDSPRFAWQLAGFGLTTPDGRARMSTERLAVTLDVIERFSLDADLAELLFTPSR